jgi:hypothetical protein
MEYMPAIFLGIGLLWFITRPFTVLLHELGHAIPFMLLTKKGADVYVGSYGDKKQSFKVKIGSLQIWVRYNPIKWGGGLCIPEAKEISLSKQIVSTISGPLFSFIIAFVFCYLAFAYDLHGFLKLIFVFAFGSTVFDLFVNLVPRTVVGANGNLLYSDGYFLFNVSKLKKFPNEYAQAVELYNKGEYEKTAFIFDDFLRRGLESEDIYRCASTSFIFIKNYKAANSIQKQFEKKYELDRNDYYNLGLTCLHLHMNDDSFIYFKKSLELDPEHPHSLNAVGYLLNTQNKFDEALPYFEKSIQNDPEFSYAYYNRGHVKIEKGELEEGLFDINYSIELNPDNSYAYRNLGIYHLKRGEKSEALNCFIKAKEMDETTDLIDELIEKAK